MASPLPGPCIRHPPAAPAASSQRAPATGRPQLRLSAQGRATGQGKPKPATVSPRCMLGHATCMMGIASCLLTMALQAMLSPQSAVEVLRGKGTCLKLLSL